MDLILFMLDYDFVSNKVKLTWKDILYAIKRNLLSPDSAITHAVAQISKTEEYDQLLFDLASLFKGESVQPYLDKLARLEEGLDESALNEKWLYLVLDWTFENKDKYTDPLGRVEEIYADFNYPEAIVSFVRYMPSDGPSLGKTKLNELQLYKKWEEYLNKQGEKFLITKNT